VNPPKCHPGTRVAILNRFSDWVKDSHSPTHISWLFGPAGAGKSAIARSLAELLTANGLLAGSFFFYRTDARRNSVKALVPTLSYQISCSIFESQLLITRALAYDPMVFYRSFRTQFEALILNPVTHIPSATSLTSSSSPIRPMLIIIDGLDECEDQNERRLVLRTIYDAMPHLCGQLKFLIASRPEFDIQTFFELPYIKANVNIVELLEDARAYDDVRIYLQESFHQLKQTHPLRATFESDWPPTDAVERLVAKSSGHFIYASTVIKYIDSPYDRPTRRLEQILGLCQPSHNPYGDLDVLYYNILSSVSFNARRSVFIDVLSTALVCGFVDLSTFYFTFDDVGLARSDRFVESLLSLEPGEVRLAFVDLKSLVVFEKKNKSATSSLSDVSMIQFSHKSFSDFLCDPSRAKDFYVNREHGYTTLAKLCLAVISDYDNLMERSMVQYSKPHHINFIIFIGIGKELDGT